MRLALLFLSLMAVACSSADSRADGRTARPDHSAAIANAADEYREWGVVGPHVLWAPELCEAPPPPSVHVTRAAGLAESGHKLFALYANDASGYLTFTGPEGSGSAPLGTTLVKEAYAPRPVEKSDVPKAWALETMDIIAEHGFYPFTEKGDTSYGVGARKDLFVMTKLAPDTPQTDAGWVYGTVAPDGTLTSAGVIESCVACHEAAPHDRLFGVKF